MKNEKCAIVYPRIENLVKNMNINEIVKRKTKCKGNYETIHEYARRMSEMHQLKQLEVIK